MAYPSNLNEETLKAKVKDDFFSDFTYEALGKIDFALLNKDDALKTQYLLLAEAKRGESDIYDSFTQLLLTIGVHKLHKFYPMPEFLAAFDSIKIAFVPYADLMSFVDRADFNWKAITPSDYYSESFSKMRGFITEILKSKIIAFDFSKDRANLKDFIKDSVLRGRHNPIKIDTQNLDLVYSKWQNAILPLINLGINWQKIRASNKNLLIESDFFLADLISKDNQALDKSLRIILNKKIEDNKEALYYEIKIPNTLDFGDDFNYTKITLKDIDAYHRFWNLYERPPEQKFWNDIYYRRDKLTPRDIMERKGAFFTPKMWSDKAKEYLTKALGQDWQEEYYIWDCAAGTGNLLTGLKHPERVFASTLDLSDVLVMKELAKDFHLHKKNPQDRLQLLENHIFQFDFLNDSFNNLPKGLQEILNNKAKREKLVMFINPPYAEASSYGKKEKSAVANQESIFHKYRKNVGAEALSELFAQFFIRIYTEIPDSILASFSTLKYINSAKFEKFRKTFKAKFLKGFMVPADTFDNVNGQFPIGFLIWDLSQKMQFRKIKVDVFNENNTFLESKNFYTLSKSKFISDWRGGFYDNGSEMLAQMIIVGPSFQSNNNTFITTSAKQSYIDKKMVANITKNNLIPFAIYLAIRLTIKATWLNDRDQFLYPNDKWQKDTEFQNDCLTFTLFHSQNRISSKEGINHFIPFSESEVGAKEAFQSHFMQDFIKGKIKADSKNIDTSAFSKPQHDNLSCHAERSEVSQKIIQQGFDDESFYNKTQSFIPTKPLKFSPEAKAVFEKGLRLWKYYHKSDNDNPNASLYDTRMHFQGRNEKGDMRNISQCKNEDYKALYYALSEALENLAAKIQPKIYEYGFLK